MSLQTSPTSSAHPYHHPHHPHHHHHHLLLHPHHPLLYLTTLFTSRSIILFIYLFLIYFLIFYFNLFLSGCVVLWSDVVKVVEDALPLVHASAPEALAASLREPPEVFVQPVLLLHRRHVEGGVLAREHRVDLAQINIGFLLKII